jgi:DNA-3-methyladenine glycosylase
VPSSPPLPPLPPALPLGFFARPTATVARDLIGKVIVRRGERGSLRLCRIIEVEAYLGPRDQASHARRGPTPRTAIMFGPPGRLYVYLIYGMYHCMNFVTERDGQAGAVLIRAAEPLLGIAGDPASTLRGPGKLCRALGVTLADKGLDLTAAASDLYVGADDHVVHARRVGRSARIGVDYAGPWAQRPLRFFLSDHPGVSGPRPARRRAVRLTSAAGSVLAAPALPSRSPRTSKATKPTPGRR